MNAAWIANERAGSPIGAIHGAVSTGAVWKFLRLEGEVVTLDIPEYYVGDLPKIMGILRRIVDLSGPRAEFDPGGNAPVRVS